MPTRDKRLDQAIRAMVRGEAAVWTPQCPAPETLLDWLEQGEEHSDDARLLDHVLGCAYCQREYATTLEAWTLSRRLAAPVVARTPRTGNRLTAWLRELTAEGITRPIKTVQSALDTLERLTAPTASLVTRGLTTPTDLQPASIAVRTPRVILRWSAAQSVPEYRVTIDRYLGRGRLQPAWEGHAIGLELAVPKQAGIEPGGLYLWQVTAIWGALESYSGTVGFVVLAESARAQMETLEGSVDAPLARIALYEAYGLYAEAQEQADTLTVLNPQDARTSAISARLAQRRAPHP